MDRDLKRSAPYLNSDPASAGAVSNTIWKRKKLHKDSCDFIVKIENSWLTFSFLTFLCRRFALDVSSFPFSVEDAKLHSLQLLPIQDSGTFLNLQYDYGSCGEIHPISNIRLPYDRQAIACNEEIFSINTIPYIDSKL